jgi:hypothetical protein
VIVGVFVSFALAARASAMAADVAVSALATQGTETIEQAALPGKRSIAAPQA